MRILVCGSRTFKDKDLMENVLKQYDIRTIIQGEARGADTLAKEYGIRRGIDICSFPALWDKHGKAAGPIRNHQMLVEGKPDLVIAFLSKDSIGTKDMIKQATNYGVEIKVVEI